jgi:hypothetical protein
MELIFFMVKLLGTILLLPFLALWFWGSVRICRKAGFSGWWSLSVLFPPLWVVLIWAMAFAEWPKSPAVEILPPQSGPRPFPHTR